MHWNRGYIDESSTSCNILHLRYSSVRQFWGSQTLEQIWSLKVDPFLVWPKFLFLFVFADISSILSWKFRFGNGLQNDPSIDWTVLDTQKKTDFAEEFRRICTALQLCQGRFHWRHFAGLVDERIWGCENGWRSCGGHTGYGIQCSWYHKGLVE